MRGTIILSLMAVATSYSAFLPSVRVDHENRTSHGCCHADIATGRPEDGEVVYVAIENDSFAGIVVVRSDIYFQKSTDAGRTWLPADVLVRRGQLFACYPDITVGPDGTIYIVFTERPSGTSGHFYIVRSTDGGNTWSAPVQIDDNQSVVGAGWVRVAMDTSGVLFCAWNDGRTGQSRIWSSVSTDGGQTWRRNVRVDDDTVPAGCFHPDVAVQPATNRYLVTATAPYWVRQGYINSNSAFYGSIDMGETWTPGFVLDTFAGYCGQPHVVADADYIVCDYTGGSGGNQNITEARTSSDGGTTWSQPVTITGLDTLYSSYLNGGKLAIDAAGTVHASLMICDLIEWEYNIYYAYSTDHGLTWSERELVNDITTNIQTDPNVAVDSAGYAYVVWQDGRNSRNEIWFSTNNWLGIGSTPSVVACLFDCEPSHFRDQVRARLRLSEPAPARLSIYDIAGRTVGTLSSPEPLLIHRFLWNGRDAQGNHCAAGTYLLKATASDRTTVRRIVMLP